MCKPSRGFWFKLLFAGSIWVSGSGAIFAEESPTSTPSTPTISTSDSTTEDIIKAFKSKGLSVSTPPAVPSATTNNENAFSVLTVKNPGASIKAQYGLVYGKVRLKLGSLVSSQQTSQLAMQKWISDIAGTDNSTYSVNLTIQRNGTDVLKAPLATDTKTESKFLGITLADQYSSTSTTGGIIIRGLLVGPNTNNLAATLQVVESDKLTFNADVAGKAADAYKTLNVAHLVPNLGTNLSPEVAAISGLVSLFFPASTDTSNQLTVPLQFIPTDRIETQHVFMRGRPIVTVTLELDDTIFQSSWDRTTSKFENPDPDVMWNEAVFLPTGKHVAELLSDDLPVTNSNAKRLKKFIGDLDGNTLTQFSKLDPQEQNAIGQTCEAMHSVLLDYFTVPDAAATTWVILNRYSTSLKANGDYMKQCLTDKLKSTFASYGLPIAALQ